MLDCLSYIWEKKSSESAHLSLFMLELPNPYLRNASSQFPQHWQNVHTDSKTDWENTALFIHDTLLDIISHWHLIRLSFTVTLAITSDREGQIWLFGLILESPPPPSGCFPDYTDCTDLLCCTCVWSVLQQHPYSILSRVVHPKVLISPTLSFRLLFLCHVDHWEEAHTHEVVLVSFITSSTQKRFFLFTYCKEHQQTSSSFT